MINAIVIDSQKRKLGECTFEQASRLLSKGRARVHSFYPYTLVLKRRLGEDGESVSWPSLLARVSARSEAQHVG